MTADYLNVMTWFIRALFFLGIVGFVLGMIFLADTIFGYYERKRESKWMDWDPEAERLKALGRVHEGSA